MHLVFVYGTLRQGDSRGGALSRCKCVSLEARLHGYALLHLGGFPGIILEEGTEPVRGEVYEISDEVLARLDGIEGFREEHPDTSLYLREKVTIQGSDGESLQGVYTYIFNRETGDRDYRRIRSGDWFGEDGRDGRTREA